MADAGHRQRKAPEPPTSRRRLLAVPAVLRPEDLTALIDSREQRPLDLAPLRTVRGTLQTGDYSIVGLEHLVALERKSLPDLVACVGRERDRFERELRRLLGYPVRGVVVETSWSDLEAGGWRGEMHPRAVTASVLSWIATGIPILLAGDREGAARAVRGILLAAARHRLRELRSFAEGFSQKKESDRWTST